MRTQLPPIFERSFEQSEMGNSLSAATGELLTMSYIGAIPHPSFNLSPDRPRSQPTQCQEDVTTTSRSHFTESPFSSTSPLLMAKDEEKWPVQKQTLIVVTRTY